MSDYLDAYEKIKHPAADRPTIDAEFRRLALAPNRLAPKAGDRVVVAAGLIGWGSSPLTRLEARVLAVGLDSVKVHISGSKDPIWIHPALVTDVIRAEPTEETPDA